MQRYFTTTITRVSPNGGAGFREPIRLPCLRYMIPIMCACYRALTHWALAWRSKTASSLPPLLVDRWPFLRRLRLIPSSPLETLAALWEIRFHRSRPVEKGIPARPVSNLPRFCTKVALALPCPNRTSLPARIPPRLVANGMIGVGEIGARNFLEPLWRILHFGMCIYCLMRTGAHAVHFNGLMGTFLSSGTHSSLFSFCSLHRWDQGSDFTKFARSPASI